MVCMYVKGLLSRCYSGICSWVRPSYCFVWPTHAAQGNTNGSERARKINSTMGHPSRQPGFKITKCFICYFVTIYFSVRCARLIFLIFFCLLIFLQLITVIENWNKSQTNNSHDVHCSENHLDWAQEKSVMEHMQKTTTTTMLTMV